MKAERRGGYDIGKLDTAVAAVLESTPKKDRPVIGRILDALYASTVGNEERAKETFAFVSAGATPEEKLDRLVAVVLGALGGVYKQSGETMPWGPALAAGQIMLFELLARAYKAGVVELEDGVIAAVSRKFLEELLSALGVTTEQMASMMKKAAAAKQVMDTQSAGGLLAGTMRGGV